MTKKPLDPNASALLAIITETFARIGRVERDALNVDARGRGIEVGRALAELKDAGLVEEYETRPGFLRRLFGAKPHVLLRPAAKTTPPDAAPEPSEPPPAQAPELPTEAAVSENTALTETVIVAEIAPETIEPEALPATEPDHAEPAASEPVHEPLAPALAAPEPAVQEEPAPAPVAPVAKPDTASAEPPAKVAVHVAPPRAPRFAPDDYTDKVGGGDAIEIGAAALDPEVLDGLRETLSDLGMELTMAGEALISDRMGRGDCAGDALSQVVLFAFAHAVHYDLLSGGGMQALGLTDYAIEVMQELEKLRDAGAITSERFEMDMRRLWSFVGDTEAGELLRADRAAEVLTDPMGGAAPTAILPEDIQTAEDPDSDD